MCTRYVNGVREHVSANVLKKRNIIINAERRGREKDRAMEEGVREREREGELAINKFVTPTEMLATERRKRINWPAKQLIALTRLRLT